MTRISSKSTSSHHNTGRPQHPKTALAGRINWFHLQVRGAYGNLHHASMSITAHPMFKELREDVQERLITACGQARRVAQELKDIAEEVSDLNSPDKWRNS